MTPPQAFSRMIHAWLTSQSPSSIAQIIKAFPGLSVTKIQNAVYLMVSEGNLTRTGERNGARYSAAGEQYKPEAVNPVKTVKTMRVRQAEAIRQATINYITDHPGALGTEIVAAMGWARSLGATRLTAMTGRGELSRIKATSYIVNASGASSLIYTYAYTCTDKAKSADKVMNEITENLADKTRKTRSDEPWRTVNIGGVREDLKDQRGQGALPPSVRRGCSLGKF